MNSAEAEFLAEKELVTIIPDFSLDKIYLIGGDLGPFNPGLPVELPLWLAVNLKQRQKCRLAPPEWTGETASATLDNLTLMEVNTSGLFFTQALNHMYKLRTNLQPLKVPSLRPSRETPVCKGLMSAGRRLASCFLSFVDTCYSSVTAPRLITDFQAKVKRISFVGCMVQLFFVHLFGCTEIFILTAMAYDRYIAICKPLRYLTAMDWKVCSTLVVSCWLGGFLHTFIQTMLTVQLPFCGPNLIDHYFCDVHPLLKLACTDTYVVGLIVVANSGLISLSCFVILVGSYIVILLSFKTRSSEGRRKALATCTSHITVVILFFVPCVFIYLRPSTTFTEDKMVAVFYTIITPMLNPLIYTLRNTEMKNAMKRLWIKRFGGRNRRDPDGKFSGTGTVSVVPISKRVAGNESVIIP
ncbi:Olfactory receptor 4S2 [Camelus dromedarius]|uniref:Olfactory receptor 4S2 n=1 Tax=Camelus dromedarius TaxID=9838 RepID=A0A5N4DMQ5_CAMDR|nr:Olfactory receptor 4S2 [Camelus dromedarius]